MRPAVLWIAFASLSVTLAAADDPLARARLLYNQREFVAAINAAEQARLTPARADSADLIAARAYLERFRESAASDDLTNARVRLRRLNPQRFSPGERLEYMVGLGEALFLDNEFGAAADLFLTVLAREGLGPESRELTLDWWASAVDRDARLRSELERHTIHQRVRDRMQDELATRPTSATAVYWLAAAALAQGDVQAAWDAVQAGWVRAPLSADQGTKLRADLDQLMLRAIVPERAKAIAQSQDYVMLEWEAFKEKWKRD